MTPKRLLGAVCAGALTFACIATVVPPQQASAQVAQQQSALWVTVRRYEGVPDPKKAAQVVNDTWIPIISKIPGFIEYFWVDAGNGVMVSTSVFQTREGEEESNTKVKQWRLSNPEANVALPNPPHITAGKVVGYKTR